MSWIKKISEIFKNNKNNDSDNSAFQGHQFQPKNGSPVEANRDVETKIYYQYPKGNFRFPLIPDDDVNERKSKRESRKRHIEQKPIQMEKVKNAPSEKSKTTRKPEQPTRVEQRRLNKSNRPFRRTEIPSPIYGFEPRPVKTKPVEYELKDFSSPVKRETERESLDNKIKNSNQQDSYSQLELDDWSIESIEGKVEFVPEQEAHPIEGNHELRSEGETINGNEEEETVASISDNSLSGSVEREEEVQINAVNIEEDSIVEESGPLEKSFVLAEETVESIQEFPKVGEEVSGFDGPRENQAHKEKNKHIPFNVLMLNEDRKKAKSKAKGEMAGEEQEGTPINASTLAENETSAALEETKNDDKTQELPYYIFPPLELLKPPVVQNMNFEWMNEQEILLNETLLNFNVRAKVVNVTQGPSVTRFEVQPEPGVKVNKITNLSDDIKLSLAAKDIRIEAPIPGKHTIGIEVPNEYSRPVLISEIIRSQEFLQNSSSLTVVLGLDISGKPIVTDLRKMPHGLIAGATGSGKSVCINSILVSLLYKANPHDVKLLLIDPKMVELAPYNQIPHLVSPVITDVKAATVALKWAVEEMEHRYELFAHAGVRDITRYNELADSDNRFSDRLPFIVIVIDELADLMMMSPADVEEAICRIAQKARACGIHLIIATQRPSVDVITGLIKANVPTRIAFSVSSQVDSRTIIDIGGAERLLGKGDMLFLENGSSKPIRLQGTFVSDKEIDDVVAHVRREQSPEYLFEQDELLKKVSMNEEEDELFYEACEFIIEQGGASTSSLQRRFKIGYNRAARLIDLMEENGFISEARGSKPRDVLITDSELESIQDTSTN